MKISVSFLVDVLCLIDVLHCINMKVLLFNPFQLQNGMVAVIELFSP